MVLTTHKYRSPKCRSIQDEEHDSGGSIAMVVCGFLSPVAIAYKPLLLIVLSVAFALSTFSRGGLYCNHQDLSPKYAAALLGISNTAGALPGIIGVWLTGKLFDITGGDWGTSLFVPIAVAQLLGALVFTKWGSGKQEWE